MLEGLDAIDWKALGHAYGPATDVPDQLRALASSDPDARAEALHALFGNICHQGTVYEASAHAVPFLIELLADDSTADRAGVLCLLGELATGSSYLDVHQDVIPDLASTLGFHEKLGRERSWVRATLEAVEAGVPEYIRLLEARDRRIRMAAAHALGACVGRADEAAQALRSAFAARPDESERFNLTLRLGTLGREADVAFLRAIPADGPIGWAAAVAIAEILRQRTPAETVARVASAFADPQPLDDLLADQPWAPVEAIEMTRQAIERMDDALAVPAMIAGVGLVEHYHAASLAADLLDRVLPAPRRPPAPPPGPLHRLGALIGLRFGDPPYRPIESLDDRQVAALRAIAEAGRAWGSIMDLSADLRSRDLPDVREALREYLDRR
ncbi:hypothetical protein [Paludisphaera sp.]|uniref:hypothetical protein n=1 Tax=Paludisphaera sp. TaxID=2017432 RepID=UPI00301B7F27